MNLNQVSGNTFWASLITNSILFGMFSTVARNTVLGEIRLEKHHLLLCFHRRALLAAVAVLNPNTFRLQRTNV